MQLTSASVPYETCAHASCPAYALGHSGERAIDTQLLQSSYVAECLDSVDMSVAITQCH